MSLNDPQWGNKRSGNQGPPDLEDLWRDFNRRLSGLFGKRGGGGEPPVRPPMNPRAFGGGVGLLILLVLLVWLGSGFYIVNASQRGVILTFGRFSAITNPGLHWRLPYPIQSSEIVHLNDVRVVDVGYRGSNQNSMPKEALMLTDDENIINIQFTVYWNVKDPKAYLFNNRNPDDSVRQAAETAMREVIGKTKMDYALYEGRNDVAQSAEKLIQKILDRYKTGIQVLRLTLQNIQPPQQVQAAFADVQNAGQDQERLVNEGQAYANDVIPRARGTAARLIAEANGYKARVVADAEGNASRFTQVLAAYERAPEVTRKRMYIETMQQILSNSSKVLVDTKGNNNLLYLPLDKLMRAAGAPAARPAPSSSSSSSSSQPAQTNSSDDGPSLDNLDYRSRDALRSRERSER